MENIKEMMKKIEGEDKEVEKTGACGYNWAIGICLTVYLGLMVFLWLGSMRAQYVWDVIVQTTLVMVIVSVVMYYVLKALFAARKEKLEAEYAAARREASIKNAAYSEAYQEYARAESLLEDARAFAREKRNMYDAAHKDTMRIRRKIDTFTDLIDAEESKVSNMVKASAKYDEVFAEYRGRKKTRFAKGRQLDAAREEYARLLAVLAEAKSRAEAAANRLYRAEKISVRDVIETDVKDPDFLYLNQYGALLAKAQADEQKALGELRRAQKKSDTV